MLWIDPGPSLVVDEVSDSGAMTSSFAYLAVHTNSNTKTHRAVFIVSTLGPGFKVCFRANENAGFVWTVGPNAQDVFTRKPFSVWTCPHVTR